MMTGHKGRPFKGFMPPSAVHNIFCMWSVSTSHLFNIPVFVWCQPQ